MRIPTGVGRRRPPPKSTEHAWLKKDGLTIGGALITLDRLKDLAAVPLVAESQTLVSA